MIKREMDFGRERQNLDHFAVMLDKFDSEVVIPRPINPLCTRRVLVMEELVGKPLSKIVHQDSFDAETKQRLTESIAKRLSDDDL